MAETHFQGIKHELSQRHPRPICRLAEYVQVLAHLLRKPNIISRHPRRRLASLHQQQLTPCISIVPSGVHALCLAANASHIARTGRSTRVQCFHLRGSNARATPVQQYNPIDSGCADTAGPPPLHCSRKKDPWVVIRHAQWSLVHCELLYHCGNKLTLSVFVLLAFVLNSLSQPRHCARPAAYPFSMCLLLGQN